MQVTIHLVVEELGDINCVVLKVLSYTIHEFLKIEVLEKGWAFHIAQILRKRGSCSHMTWLTIIAK